MTCSVSRTAERLRHGASTAITIPSSSNSYTAGYANLRGGASSLAVSVSSGGGSQRSLDYRAPERALALVGDTDGAAPASRAPRILVVEDDPGMGLLCSVNLELAGFDVELAATGLEGLERANQEQFDIVLLDVMLPDLGGLDVAERLRSAPGTERLPIVFFSARASQADIEQGRLAGAIDYIVKPFDPLTLADRLLDDLDEHRRLGHDGVRRLRFGPPR